MHLRPILPFDEYAQYTGDVAFADETLLQPSKFALIPLRSPCILMNFIDIQGPSWHEIALLRIHWRVHELSRPTRLFAHPTQFNTCCEIGVICGTSHLTDHPPRGVPILLV